MSSNGASTRRLLWKNLFTFRECTTYLSKNIVQKDLPSSGTEVTVGTDDGGFRGDFSSDGADLLQRLCPASSTMLGRTLTGPPPLLGPQVLPFTPSAGTIGKF